MKTKPLLSIGASKEAVKEARAAINDILKSVNCDNSTKVEALKTLSTLCSVNNLNISGCNFKG